MRRPCRRGQKLLNVTGEEVVAKDMELVRDADLEALANAVAVQSEALAHLRFKFEVQQMMLSGGRATWVDETTKELEEAIGKVHDADVVFRQRLSAAASRSLGLSPESTLREVAAASGEPWRYIFEQGREELRRSIERVSSLCAENRRLLARGYLATSEALTLLGVATGGLSYDATGSPAPARLAATILNTKA